jgi:hypothetical protein
MESRSINEQYAETAAQIIEEEESLVDIANSHATIVYLSSDRECKSKDKITHAVCEKVADKNKWAIPCDFTITVYEPNVVGFTDEQIRILLFHELLHVGIEFTEDGQEKYSIKPHDYEDFKIITDRYGTDWSKVE